VVCSPALRATQTWHLAAGKLDPPPPVRQDDRLYEATGGDLLAVTRELPPEVSTALLVGHNPGLEEFLALLTGARHPLKTATIAVITTPASWAHSQPGAWTLSKLATPRGR
jgi:phosphohistidine phosphatase